MSSLLLFNKPYDVICQFSSSNSTESTLANFIKRPNFYPAGRLDKNSEGLLLLTDDGKLQHRLSHPNSAKKKYYWVQVEGSPVAHDLKSIQCGLAIKTTQYKPASIRVINQPRIWPRTPPIRVRNNIPTSWLEIILTEGKNHQIRKMTAAIGFPTLRLIRYQIAQWHLEDLQPGEQRLYQLP